MVRLCLLFTALVGCSQPFVMKPQNYAKPVMVGPVRHIGGEPTKPEKRYEFAAEIEITDTPVSASHDWHEGQAHKLDEKLSAASVYGYRDTVIEEMAIGSYIFNALLFYLDKDWIRVQGYSERPLAEGVERRYVLDVPPKRMVGQERKSRFERSERKKKKEKTKRRPTRRRRR